MKGDRKEYKEIKKRNNGIDKKLKVNRKRNTKIDTKEKIEEAKGLSGKKTRNEKKYGRRKRE